MDILDMVREAGVIGSGGAGFPTHVKLKAHAEYILLNGAECEPLQSMQKRSSVGYCSERRLLGQKKRLSALRKNTMM